MVDAVNNWDVQEEEIESLKYIYPDEMTVLKEKPYSVEIIINSNTESEDRNFLKMKVLFDLQNSYPDCTPHYRLKNLSPDYMDNNFLDRCETVLTQKGSELTGTMMIFEMCELIKEMMSSINDEVLNRLDAIAEKNTVEYSLKATETSMHLTYTPVNAETFKVWCDRYKENLRLERMAFETGIELKLTGRQLFEKNKSAFEDLTLDETEIEVEEPQKEEEVVEDF